MRMSSFKTITGGLLLICGSLVCAADKQRRNFELTAFSAKFWNLVDHNAKLSTVATGFGFTEGPVWDKAGFLYVSDEEQNKIYRVYLDGRKETLVELGDPEKGLKSNLAAITFLELYGGML